MPTDDRANAKRHEGVLETSHFSEQTSKRLTPNLSCPSGKKTS